MTGFSDDGEKMDSSFRSYPLHAFHEKGEEVFRYTSSSKVRIAWRGSPPHRRVLTVPRPVPDVFFKDVSGTVRGIFMDASDSSEKKKQAVDPEHSLADGLK